METEYTAIHMVKGELTINCKVTEIDQYGPDSLMIKSFAARTEYFATFDTATGHRLEFALVPRDGKTYTVLTKNEG